MVTIVIPMLNEEKYVARCLDSVLSQVSDLGLCEVLCVDGESTDRTREIVAQYALRYGCVRLLRNPERIQSTAMNIGISHASGEIIIRLDCHACYAPNYLKNCVELLKRTGADNVGGYIDTAPGEDTPVARANAAVVSSHFGVGGSMFRIGGGEMEVDTVPFGCFRRSLFERLGLYDVRLVRNEDLELSHRIRTSGGKIIISPSIRATYFMRPTFSGLRRQAFDNGFWNTSMLYLLHSGLSPRHLVPLFFVLSIIALGVGGIFVGMLWVFLSAEMIVYTSMAFAAAAKVSTKSSARIAIIMLSFIQLHLCYGVGSLYGLIVSPYRLRSKSRNSCRSRIPSDVLRQYELRKRSSDVLLALLGLVLTSPVIAVAAIAVWLQDRHIPIYFAQRTGKNGTPFVMYKIRTMAIGADQANVWATTQHDSRITPLGRIIRSLKLDELPQLLNVLKGEMSMVGPRPLALSETASYTSVEKDILSVTPGITDIASIAFSDEASLLTDCSDPDAAYDTLIRPWKSRLALLYVQNRSAVLDAMLVIVTGVAIIHRPSALTMLSRVMARLHADATLIDVATGKALIEPTSPPCA